MTPGMAIDARIAASSGPVAAHRFARDQGRSPLRCKGIDNSSMVMVPSISRTVPRNRSALSTPAAVIEGRAAAGWHWVNV